MTQSLQNTDNRHDTSRRSSSDRDTLTDPRAALVTLLPELAADAQLVAMSAHDVLQRSIRCLDRMQVNEIHTVGVVYVANAQVTEQVCWVCAFVFCLFVQCVTLL
jgi:hypothetical protein